MDNLVQAAADNTSGGNVAELARLIEVPLRTVRDWKAGNVSIPAAAVTLLTVLAETDGAPEMIEAARKKWLKRTQ